MRQDKGGLKGAISMPAIYNLVQLLAGARMYRNRMVKNYIQPFNGCRILDIGCGTGEYVEFLDRHCKDYEYFGFDDEAAYISRAQRLYRDRPSIHFYHRTLGEEQIAEFSHFDIVLAIGVMHHMDDPLVLSLLRLAKEALKLGGRLISYDPGRFSDMNTIERFFVQHDRGRHIRSQEGYAELVGQVFPSYKCHVAKLTYYPCRNIIFECLND